MRTPTKFYELTADVPNPEYDGRAARGPQSDRAIAAGTRYSMFETDVFEPGVMMPTYRRMRREDDTHVPRDVATAIEPHLTEVEGTVTEQMIAESIMPYDVWEAMRRNPAVAHAMMDTFRTIRDEER